MNFIRRAYRMPDDGYDMQLLKRFELLEHKDKPGKELSKGMQQKLSICCTLLHRPRVLIFDEPMVGLDPHAIKQLKLIVEEQAAAGRTLLISTHIIDSVELLWDRALIMQNGGIRANLTREELDADGRTLEQLFFDVTESVAPQEMAGGAAAERTPEAGAAEGTDAPGRRGLFWRPRR